MHRLNSAYVKYAILMSPLGLLSIEVAHGLDIRDGLVLG